MTTDIKPKHKEGTKQINIWVDGKVIEKWDLFLKGYGVNRTNFLIAAANEYIENHSGSTNGHAMKKVQENVLEIKGILEKKEERSQEEAARVNDTEIRLRLVALCKEKPRDFETLSFLLGFDGLFIANVVQELKRENHVTLDVEGFVHAIEE